MSGSETRKRQDKITVRVLFSEKNSMKIQAKKNNLTVPAYLRWLHEMEVARGIVRTRGRS